MDFLQPATVGEFSIDRYWIPPQINRHDVAGRPTGTGQFTRIVQGNVIWMSDTQSEIEDHFPFFDRVGGGDHVLITGLGLGVAVVGAIKMGAETIHVVELNEDVRDLIAPQMQDYAEARGVEFHTFIGDARTWEPPEGVSYDLAWHDIWPTISDDNLTEMEAMRDHYGPYVDGPQECWAEDHCAMMQRIMAHVDADHPIGSFTPEELAFVYRTVVAQALGGY